jgi:exodeoxyribonuclease VII large subunit
VEDERRIFTLAQLNTSLENHFLKFFASKSFWVTAEIAKISVKQGHRYLELVDSKDGQLAAQLSGYMWFAQFNSIRSKIGPELDELLKPGNKVLFLLKIEFHKVFGLKVNVQDIDPTYSYGEIERKKQETIRRLKEEGLYELQKKLVLPRVIRKIALIGSPDTSGYRDFLNELTHNSVYRNFAVKEFAASVQGDRAELELINALKEARTWQVDVIVFVRGGGSKMDLNVFNSYALGKEIAQTNIPVMTGIGHETDEVVADLVCRLSQITPTAVAKYIYVQIGTYLSELRAAFDGIMTKSVSLLSSAKEEFAHTGKYFMHYSQRLVTDTRAGLEQRVHGFHRVVQYLIGNQMHDLDLLLHKCEGASLNQLKLAKQVELPALLDRLLLSGKNDISLERLEINNLEQLLAMLNPEKLMRSGYTLSTVDDVDIVHQTENLEGKEMKTLTTHSVLVSKIIKQEKIQVDHGQGNDL